MSDERGFTFCCFQCKRPAFLIRGYCDRCAPALHRNYQDAGKATNEMCDRFQTQTGKNALSAWHEFESWVESQPDAAEYEQKLKSAMLTPAPNGAIYDKWNSHIK